MGKSDFCDDGGEDDIDGDDDDDNCDGVGAVMDECFFREIWY